MAKSVAKLADECAVLLQKLVRMKYADDSGHLRCVTCNTSVHWKDAQGGHFISRVKSFHKLREENIHPQCSRCNGPLRGNLVAYTLFMQDTYGRDFVEWLEQSKNTGRKWVRSELEDLRADLKERIREQDQRLAGV